MWAWVQSFVEAKAWAKVWARILQRIMQEVSTADSPRVWGSISVRSYNFAEFILL